MPDYSDTRIQFRRGTTNQWSAANPTLGIGEPGYDTDTGALKVGDGTSDWNALSSISNGVQSNTKPVENKYNGASSAVVSGVYNIVICNQDTYDNQSSYDPNTIYFVQ